MRKTRLGSGVEALKTTIRVRFVWQGQRHTFNLGMPPTRENIKAAERKMARVFRDIDLGIFELRRHFVEPQTGRS
ncbi:MAG: DUF3596 domain-containing protein [Sphingomonas taxi]